MTKELKELMDMLEARRMHPAMRTEEDLATAKEEGRDLHPLVLSPTRNNPSLIYIHPERLLQELAKRDEKLNLLTLEFEEIEKETPPKPAPEPSPPTEEKPPEEKKPAEKPEEKPKEPEGKLPDEVQLYTKDELELMSKAELLKIAGIDPDVNTKGVKAELIEKLTGRPKFPLE